MIDIAALSQTVTAFLAPTLPYLLQGGEKAEEGALKELGKDAWGKAKEAWTWLSDKVAANPLAQASAQELASQSNDNENQTVFEIQLKKLLNKDNKLAEQLAELMKDQVVQRVVAERGGKVRKVQQTTEKGATEQEVRASDAGSEVEDVKQRRL